MHENFETIQYSQDQQIGTLVISRPQALNALNQQVLREMNQLLDDLDADRELRGLIITGSGERAFVAGADIKEIHELKPESARNFARRGQGLFRRLEVMRIPVAAAVHGFALGGGCELALSCDFIYAASTAKFGLPEVGLGLIPGFGGTQRLARQVGLNRAREMIYTGATLTAEEAYKIGLVNRVLPGAELLTELNKTMALLKSRAPLAIARAKQAINCGFDRDLDSGLELERDLFSELFATEDQQEGTAAFLEKRPPQFKAK